MPTELESGAYSQVAETSGPGYEPDDAVALRPSEVRAVRGKGHRPSLPTGLLVERSSRHQEFTDELSLPWASRRRQRSQPATLSHHPEYSPHPYLYTVQVVNLP